MVGQPVSIFNARVKTVCLCFGIDREKAGCLPFRDKRIRSHDRIVCNNKQGKTGMKTENTLRTVRNSLLCFFTALGAGFLVACGGGGGGTSTYPAYFVDAPVEGAEYSGPTSSDLTGENGEFVASNGVFEFSVGATTLGSVRLSASSDVTPFDFIGVGREEAITIARIVQGLDYDGNPRNGISISQSTRDGVTVDLFAMLTMGSDDGTEVTAAIPVVVNNDLTLTIPPRQAASDHLFATRRCLFSGGYEGRYRQTATSDSSSRLDEGRAAFVVEPFVGTGQVRGVEFSNVYSEDNDRALVVESIDLREIRIGRAITLSPGNELTFVSSRLATGIWSEIEIEQGVTVTGSGTYELALVVGEPDATRRVVGVDSTGSTATGLYVIDQFADGNFRGQYYDVEKDELSALSLAIINDGVWPTAGGTPTTLTLSGTSGEENITVAVEVTRTSGSENNNYGIFGDADEDTVSGSWCDLRTVSGGAPAISPLVAMMSHSRIGGDVSAHRLSRYLDSGFPANTAIDGVQILG